MCAILGGKEPAKEMIACGQWHSSPTGKHHLKFYFHVDHPFQRILLKDGSKTQRGEKGRHRWTEPEGNRLLNWNQGCDSLVWASRTQVQLTFCPSFPHVLWFLHLPPKRDRTEKQSKVVAESSAFEDVRRGPDFTSCYTRWWALE